jgi:hypothetical protein
MTCIVVIAKSPVPGRVKTRLCPPLTPLQAALVAEAALRDTLDAALAVRGARTVLALDGPRGRWLPRRVRVIRQRGAGLDERIAAAFCDAGTPALLIGMDTPQVPSAMLAVALDTLLGPATDAVLGAATDGGWWAAGLRRADPRAFAGVPMSTPRTYVAQRRRLGELGLRIAELPAFRDVDTMDDAIAVAREAPRTRFAMALDAVVREPALTTAARP